MSDITDLQVGQGETFSIHLQLQYISGSTAQYIDISNYSFEGQIRENYTTEEIAAHFNFTYLLPESGSLTVSLTPEQTLELYQRQYVYDIKMSTDESPPTVRRILEGAFHIRPAITR
jgi:hypothetical protein